ncbi:hypothetical protein MY1884_003957 [Beauveria asiatica]
MYSVLAGDGDEARRVARLLAQITKAAVYCGSAIGNGLRTKFATNLFLITMTAGLAEAMNLARAQGKTPLMTVCDALYKEAVERGFGGDDMIAIHKVMTAYKGPT